jgi:ferric-dicitrate binding protein FerR (iron transport regulator)
MEIDDLYISLIIRNFKKDISEQEKIKLFKWVYSCHENEKFYYHLKDIWETSGYDAAIANANINHEWEKFALSAIEEESEHFKERKLVSRNIKKILRIAALVIITFGIGFFVQKNIPEKTTFTSVRVPYGAKSEVELPDGSRVWVNSGSNIKYPANFNGKEVNLFLEGEAYFDIVKNPKRKLNVKTSSINIQVLGTRFNVKSYNDEDVVETTLVNGSISITGKIGEKLIKEPIYLKPSEQAVLVKSRNTVKISRSGQASEEQNAEPRDNQSINRQKEAGLYPMMKINERIDVEPFVSWKDNRLVFKGERFDELAVKMERWYNVEIVIVDEELKSARYTGTFENETIGQAINALSISLPFTYKMEKNHIEIIKRD